MSKLFSKIRQAAGFLHRKPVVLLIISAVLLNFLLESLGRRSPLEALLFLCTKPHIFLYNALIVGLTLSPSMLFSKREFALSLISAVWLGLGVANCYVLAFRTTPLSVIDILLLDSVWSVITVYLRTWQIVIVAVGFAVIIAGLVWLCIKAPRSRVHLLRGVATVGVALLATFGATEISLSVEAVSDEIANLADAYDEYGFAYCFSASVIDRGIKKPQDYSVQRIGSIMASLPAENEHEVLPNILFVQLESFVDMDFFRGITLSGDPIPAFRALRDGGLSGRFTVPSFGAGTANTEFEVISGMRVRDFGTGEYPYKTILQRKACESVCTVLAAHGMESHAIHNHVGSFYDRDNVYKALGFNTFTPVEYMSDVSYNYIGWAKDSVLTGEIFKAFDSTECRDFVYVVTVQTHGKYPRTDTAIDYDITVSGAGDDEQRCVYEYFVSQLQETDRFIAELCTALSEWDEPVCVVFFGDHMPNFDDLSEEDITDGDLFSTEYAVWYNYRENISERLDLRSCELYAEILSRLSCRGGVMSALYQSGASDEAVAAVEYDMLYGRGFTLECDYKPTDMKLGVAPVEVLDIIPRADGTMIVKGRNFTAYSVVYVDGTRQETRFADSSTLICEHAPDKESTVCVWQVGALVKLGCSNELVFTPKS